jgi:peptidoglycan/xylan/chitin deacetylase (PgdA/CDA1 family)
MISSLTIIMYHYVRDVERTRFPAIKARSVATFRGQLKYVCRHYRMVSAAELMQAVRDPAARLPSNAALLTFDDGFIDHYTSVLPAVADLGVAGLFAPVGKAVLEHKVLDVHKIQFLLAAAQGRIGQVLVELFELLDRYRHSYLLESNQAYWDRLAHPNRFDPAEVIFVKRMLQRDLPEDLRSLLCHELFHKYVTADERSFAAELYMNLDQLREMSRAGMGIASHGYDHHWLGTLPETRQAEQIRKSLDFLNLVADTRPGWMFSYPYGSHNPSLLALARQNGCIAGFTTEVAIAAGGVDPLLLPRLDTNDLPTAGDAEPLDWTTKAIPQVP